MCLQGTCVFVGAPVCLWGPLCVCGELCGEQVVGVGVRCERICAQ